VNAQFHLAWHQQSVSFTAQIEQEESTLFEGRTKTEFGNLEFKKVYFYLAGKQILFSQYHSLVSQQFDCQNSNPFISFTSSSSRRRLRRTRRE
jgi:hypothetical protein